MKPLPEGGSFTDKIIAPMLEPVIYELAVSNPTWVFEEMNQTSGHDRTIYAKGFNVFDSRQNPLGKITLERNYGKRNSTPWVFEITNRRISQTRERGHAVITGNAKVALKTIKKYFSAPTINEKVDVIAQAARHMAYSASVNAREEYEDAHKKVGPAVHAYVTDNWAQVLDSMKDSDRAIAETLPSLKGTHRSAQSMLDQIHAKQHLTVLIDGDTYITHDGGTTQTYSSDDLPIGIKTNLGLLKLMESGKPVLDVGIRISEHTFVLYKGAKNGAAI
jgi:hypothetical protein